MEKFQQNPELELDKHNDAMSTWSKQKELAGLVTSQRLDIEGKAQIGSQQDIFNKSTPARISEIDRFNKGQMLF